MSTCIQDLLDRRELTPQAVAGRRFGRLINLGFFRADLVDGPMQGVDGLCQANRLVGEGG
jgi:hypothetical protein